MQQNRLQPHQFQHRQKHADQRALCVGVVQQTAQADRLVLHHQPPFHIVDHLRHRDRFFIDIQNRPLAQAGQNVLKDPHQVDRVGSDLALCIERIAALFASRRKFFMPGLRSR